MSKHPHLMSIVLLALIVAARPAPAQTARDAISLANLDSLWNVALKTNPNQKVYRLKAEQYRYKYREAKSFVFPQLSGSFNTQDNLTLPITPVPGVLIGKPGQTVDLRFGTKYANATGITASKSILDWQSIFSARAARDNIRLNDLQQGAYEQSLKEEVAANYYSILIAHKSIAISKHDLALADSIVQLSKQKLNEGVADTTAVNSARINYNEVAQNLGQSQELYNQSVSALKQLLGGTEDTQILAGTMPGPDGMIDAIPDKIGYDKNLDIYKLNSDIAAIQQKQQLAATFPKLSAYGYLGAQQNRQSFGLDFASDAWSKYRYIGLSLQIPIFTGLSNLNKYKIAKLDRKIAETQYDDALNQSGINDSKLIRSFKNYLAITQSSKTNYLLYRQNMQIAETKFKDGLSDAATYYKTFEDYLGAEAAYLNNLSKLLSVQATIIARN